MRINILKIKLILASIKYWYRINHYREWDKEINTGTISVECSRYSEVEIWSHIVQYRVRIQFWAKFITNTYKELKQVQPETITNAEMRSFINDIRKFFRWIKEDYKKIKVVLA